MWVYRMNDRQEQILALINKEKKIEVVTLANTLNVSQVTIRKDLDTLEQRGLLHREHGYAVINTTDDINKRLIFNYDLKRAIAVAAAKTVKNGESIMIESGSTCALLAEEIVRTKRDVLIITNSAFIASYIRKNEHCQTILLGGAYQQDAQVTVGPLTRLCAKQFSVDKLFVGVDGFDVEIGFTNSDIMRADTSQAMAESAKQVIVLTDSSKFKQASLICQFTLDAVDTIYTDADIPSEIREFLKEEKVNLHIIEK